MKNKGLNIALAVLGVGVAGFLVYKLVTGKKGNEKPKVDLTTDEIPPKSKGLRVDDEDLPKTDITKLVQRFKGKQNVNVSELTLTKDTTM
jgi:hypothetical protein